MIDRCGLVNKVHHEFHQRKKSKVVMLFITAFLQFYFTNKRQKLQQFYSNKGQNTSVIRLGMPNGLQWIYLTI